MRNRTLRDLMSAAVVTAHPEEGLKDIARRLSRNDVTALPVTEANGRVVGVVSEADLLRAQARRPDPSGLDPSLLLPHTSQAPAPGVTAGDLMTSPPITARPGWNVVEAARVMQHHHVKRLPVVDEADRLVGIVSRADLLRVFLRRDEAIAEEITEDVLHGTLHLAPAEVTVSVHDGRVSLHGTVEDAELVPVLERLCRGVDGVVDVESVVGGPRLTGAAQDVRRTAEPSVASGRYPRDMRAPRGGTG
ncbi:CBS domain-containing protein [Streptomyces sp. NPDC059740]|uniref:CBS domain-containing protein n=1 Tax=Streptomyces sp. NPDC059740 TaxID=3346926 RepID=UPI00365B0BF3